MSDHNGSPADGRGTLWQLPTRTRRLLLVAPPLVLAGFTILHPQPDHNVQALIDASTWFMVFHMIQLLLVGLVAISVLLLADDLGRASAWPVSLGMGIFLIFFSAYDTLAGIGTGLAMRSARGLPASQQDAVFGIVETWPALEPWVFWLSLLGTFGWVLALGYLAMTARAAGAPRSQWVFLGLAAVFFLLGHPAPFGTIAFGSLFVAALMHDRQAASDHRVESLAPRRSGSDEATSRQAPAEPIVEHPPTTARVRPEGLR